LITFVIEENEGMRHDLRNVKQFSVSHGSLMDTSDLSPIREV
jgi:hypothetical protein